MNMVEKVARAICRSQGSGHDDSWRAFEPHARAAIEAMREPSGAAYEWGARENVIFHWKVMIDAALQEDTEAHIIDR